MWRQPKAVWAVAFASVVAFMGIGLVDPILKPIADNLDASPSQVSLLFTSYMAVMGVAMLVTGVVASRIGPKRTLLLGLVVIIAGAGLAGMSDTVMGIVGWRALWGLGNALFIATALATIVSSARGSVAQAIILYEAALGLGIAVGPLVGGVLGSISWRGPFFGVSALMAIALVVTAVLLPPTPARRARHHPGRPVPRAAPPRAARGRHHRAAVQLRVLHPAGVHPVPARHERPPDRADLLRLGPRAGVHLGRGGAAAAAPVRHRADADRQPAGDVGHPGRDGAGHRQQGGAGRLRRGRGSVHRHQQHPDHRDRDEGGPGGARRRLGGVQLRAVLRRRGRAVAGRVLGERISVHLPFWVGAGARPARRGGAVQCARGISAASTPRRPNSTANRYGDRPGRALTVGSDS